MRNSKWLAVVLTGAMALPAAGLTMLTAPTTAQEKAAVEAPAKAGAKKERAAPRGRLPAYYADVVTEEQREKIYTVQRKYADQLKKLQEQIEALEGQRDAEIEAVLTPEQKAKVAERAAAAAKARSSNGKAAADVDASK